MLRKIAKGWKKDGKTEKPLVNGRDAASSRAAVFVLVVVAEKEMGMAREGVRGWTITKTRQSQPPCPHAP